MVPFVGLPPPRGKRICHNRIPPNRRGTFRIRTIPALPHTYHSTIAIPLKITSKTGPKTLHSPSLSEVVDLTSSRSCCCCSWCCSWAAATRLAASSTEVSAPARITEREGGSLLFEEPLRAALSPLGRTIQYNNVLGGGQKGSKKEGRAAAAVHVHEIPVCEKREEVLVECVHVRYWYVYMRQAKSQWRGRADKKETQAFFSSVCPGRGVSPDKSYVSCRSFCQNDFVARGKHTAAILQTE